MHDRSRHFHATPAWCVLRRTDQAAYAQTVSVWLVVGDSELGALILAIGEEAGIPVAAIEPETVATLLNRDERPEAMLVSRSLVPKPLDPHRLQAVSRVAVATVDSKPDGEDGFHPGLFLKLPASLEDVEHALRWLAVDGDQADGSSSSEASSSFA
jgi:hypothetical protein